MTLWPVLLAEDSTNDALLFRLAFEEDGILNPLIIVENGLEVTDYLSSDKAQQVLPALLITDLRMPVMDGFGLLAWVQHQPHLKHLPIVVLSSSSEPEDRLRALALGARDYAQKTASYEETRRCIQNWHRCWLSCPHGVSSIVPPRPQARR